MKLLIKMLRKQEQAHRDYIWRRVAEKISDDELCHRMYLEALEQIESVILNIVHEEDTQEHSD